MSRIFVDLGSPGHPFFRSTLPEAIERWCSIIPVKSLSRHTTDKRRQVLSMTEHPFLLVAHSACAWLFSVSNGVHVHFYVVEVQKKPHTQRSDGGVS